MCCGTHVRRHEPGLPGPRRRWGNAGALRSAQAAGGAPAGGGDEARMDAQLEDDLAAMGIASPVTKATAGALYHQELSRQARPRGRSDAARARARTCALALVPERAARSAWAEGPVVSMCEVLTRGSPSWDGAQAKRLCIGHMLLQLV